MAGRRIGGMPRAPFINFDRRIPEGFCPRWRDNCRRDGGQGSGRKFRRGQAGTPQTPGGGCVPIAAGVCWPRVEAAGPSLPASVSQPPQWSRKHQAFLCLPYLTWFATPPGVQDCLFRGWGRRRDFSSWRNEQRLRPVRLRKPTPAHHGLVAGTKQRCPHRLSHRRPPRTAPDHAPCP